MFHPKGWISLRQAFELINYAYYSKSEHPKWGEFTGDENFEITWRFAEEADEIAVCNDEGKILNASEVLVFAENPYNHSNAHTNLFLGTVGSSDWEGADGQQKTEEQLRKEYGPFLYLPIIFRMSHFTDFLTDFEGGSPKKYSNAPETTKARIIELFDSNGSITFDFAKRECGPTQSARGFRFAWNLAREERPEISKPGPRPKL